CRRSSIAQAAPRAASVRSQRYAVRECRPRPALSARRSAHTEHRRFVCRRDEQEPEHRRHRTENRGRNSEMNSPSNIAPESPNQPQGTTAIAPTRPFYWSVLRELWENRSIYIAPLIVAVVVLFGFLLTPIALAGRSRAVL